MISKNMFSAAAYLLFFISFSGVIAEAATPFETVRVATPGKLIDFAALYVVEFSAAISHLCHELLIRRPLRAGDTIQLASCIYLRGQIAQPTEFISYDQRLNEAAAAEGLEVARA